MNNTDPSRMSLAFRMNEIHSGFSNFSTSQKISTFTLAAFISYSLYVFSRSLKKKSNIVVAPGLPIIGNLMTFIPPNKVYININKIINKYGSMIEMWIFSHRIVVISDITVAKEIMMKRPKTFCRTR